MKKNVDITIEMIHKIKNDQKDVIDHLLNNTDWGMDHSMELFINGVSLLTPQSYGPRIQKKIEKEFNFKKISSAENAGDFEDSSGQRYECKASLLTHSKSRINFVQIRPYQKDIEYLLFVFDIRDEFKEYVFKLDKKQMNEELKKIGSLAHGVNKHQKSEYRISLKLDEENNDFKRWLKKYQINTNNLIKSGV